MRPTACVALIVAMVVGINGKESTTCDQTSLLQVSSTIRGHRSSTIASDPEGKSIDSQVMAAGDGSKVEKQTGQSLADRASKAPEDPAEWKTMIKGMVGEELVGKVFKLFGKGKLKDKDKCKHALADLWTTDAAIDFRGPQDATYFKKYDSGHDGICEYFNNSYNTHLHDLKVNMYNKGDKLVDVWSYIPGYAGKNTTKSSKRVTQYNMFSFNENKSKLTGMEVLFDKPEVLDRLSFGKTKDPVKTTQMDIAAKVLDAFSKRKFAGNTCQTQASQLFASDVEIDQTPYFDKFVGLDGVCDYFDKCYMADMHNLSTNMYARGDDVVMVLKYVPGLANLGIKASSPITQFSVFQFHKDKSKVAGFSVFFDKPSIFTELTKAATQKMMAGVMAATAHKDKAALTIQSVMSGEASEGKKKDNVAILDDVAAQEESLDIT